MKKVTYLFIILSHIACSQSIDESFSQKKMRKDLEVFKNTRIEANSGLYKYRTEEQIDSIYNWADKEIEKSSTYRDFYNIICQLTDFEGSSHNKTYFSKKHLKNLKEETSGYFPYPIKWIDGKWLLNFEGGKIPVGSEIVEINDIPIAEIISNLYKYYTTDGENLTGKKVGIRGAFPRYFRLHYGLIEQFKVSYKLPGLDAIENINLESIGHNDYKKNVNKMYSLPIDKFYYTESKDGKKYNYKQIDGSTGKLTIYTFAMGNETTEEHKTYIAFLDNTFSNIKAKSIKNLIVDIRYNGGGTDPNDLVTYSYMTQRSFQENKKAWISFEKIPQLKYVYTKVPRFLRPLGVRKYNKMFTEDFYVKKDNGLYQGPLSKDQEIREPNKNAFTGNIYLLISPQVASAGSLFAAMVAGNKNTIVIGEETLGGYYGHNGHTELGYILPKSKIESFFSVVNLEQDVPKKANQIYNRGIIPDFNVTQTFEDYLNQKDTQMEFTIKLIEKNQME